MSESKNSANKLPIYKKWWFWVIIVVFLFAGIGSIGSDSHQTEITDGTNVQENLENDRPQSQSNNEAGQGVLSDMDLRRIIMVDTVSKWNDVDEFSLTINKNSEEKYQGEYTVVASANYNGPKADSTDSVLSYCNKVTMALDLAKAPVAELTISWTIPKISNEVAGKCHYHNKDGMLVYDNESTGILENK